MYKNLKLVSILILVFSIILGNTCDTAEDYGLINSGAIIAGELLKCN